MANLEQIDLPLGGGYQKLIESTFNPSRTVNLYDVYSKSGKKSVFLRRFDGYKRVLTLLGNVGRAAFEYGDYLYLVISERVYQIDSSLTINPLGTLSTSSGFVAIAANQRQPTPQIIFVDGAQGWIWDGSAFTQITDPNFPANPVDVVYQNERFIVVSGASDKFYFSAINDGLSWPLINQLRILKEADVCTGCAVLNGILFIFGRVHIEAFNYAPNLSPPYVPDNSFSPNVGAASTASIVISGSIDESGNGCVFFLANTKDGKPSIMKLTGTSLVKLSTAEVEEELQLYPSLLDFRGDTYTEGGHTFYQLSSTANDHTWVYDDTTSIFFEKEMLNGSRFQGQAYVYFNNRTYMLGYDTNYLYEVRHEYFNYDGQAVRRYRITPILSEKNYQRILRGRLKIDAKQSVGLFLPPDNLPGEIPIPDNSPVIKLYISGDGGATYTYYDEAPLAPIGQYNWYTIFRKLGVGMSNVFRLENSNNIDFNLYGASLEYEVLPT